MLFKILRRLILNPFKPAASIMSVDQYKGSKPSSDVHVHARYPCLLSMSMSVPCLYRRHVCIHFHVRDDHVRVCPHAHVHVQVDVCVHVWVGVRVRASTVRIHIHVSVSMQQVHAAWRHDIQRGHGHAAGSWTYSLDMDMQHEHRHGQGS